MRPRVTLTAGSHPLTLTPVNDKKRSSHTMLKMFFTRRRPSRFQWKPAVDFSNPRVIATLTTFAGN